MVQLEAPATFVAEAGPPLVFGGQLRQVLHRVIQRRCGLRQTEARDQWVRAVVHQVQHPLPTADPQRLGIPDRDPEVRHESGSTQPRYAVEDDQPQIRLVGRQQRSVGVGIGVAVDHQ
jgi:hypothetical protein